MSDGPAEPHSPRSLAPLGLPAALPSGTIVQQVAYASGASPHPTLVEFPAPVGRRAVLLGSDSTALAGGELTVLAVPALAHETTTEADSPLFAQLRQWVAAGGLTDDQLPLVMTFQGTQLCWSPGRVAVLAPPERLESVSRAVIEVAFYDGELRAIQRALGEAWPQMEADMALAFEFAEADLPQRTALRERFRTVAQLRARLTRISQQVHTPHQHPPTLASQIGERFRDRARMESRYEFLDEQIEMFEGVYEQCGQRASDFAQARSGHILECIIIILLVTQLLLSGFDMLAAATATTPKAVVPAPTVSSGQGQ